MENLEYILSQHTPGIIGMDKCKKSAVCIPLIRTERGYDILFEIRSAKIDSQPGDICLPGGMVESGEEPKEAALREICEELLIEPSQIQMLGLTDLLLMPSLVIYPYAVMLSDYEETYSSDEVEKVFRVPLDFFRTHKPEVYQIEMPVVPPEDFPYDRIVGGRDYRWRRRIDEIYFYKYGNYNIWGLTAKIMDSFRKVLDQKCRVPGGNRRIKEGEG